ncbi:MAG: IS256 family transposase [Terriglobales bacterium]
MKAETGYRIVGKQDVLNSGVLASQLAKDGQTLLPIVELIAQGQSILDEVVDVMGRETIQAILELSATQVAGEWHQGRRAEKDSGIHRFGHQEGIVPLSDRNIRVNKPRLRTKGRGKGASKEVAIPAYEKMRENAQVGAKMLAILTRGVSTRNYRGALRDMAGTVGVSKSSVSREFIEKTEKAHDELMARRFDDVSILVIYLDGMIFGTHHVLTALGIDDAGKKWILGIEHGTSENAAAAKKLLTGLVERGIKPEVKRLFIIDGGKALRAAVNEVYGSENPVQRCTVHKVRNVVGHLPKERAKYARMVMQAAFKMEGGKGQRKLEELARDLEGEYPGAACSLREGLDEMFTVSRMNLPSELTRSLRSTNIIESPQSLIAQFSGRVKNWQSPAMVLRWHAAACQEAERRMHKVGGFKQLWLLEAALGRKVAQQKKVA